MFEFAVLKYIENLKINIMTWLSHFYVMLKIILLEIPTWNTWFNWNGPSLLLLHQSTSTNVIRKWKNKTNNKEDEDSFNIFSSFNKTLFLHTEFTHSQRERERKIFTNEEKFPWCHFHFSFQFQFYFFILSFFSLAYLMLKTFAFQKEWRNRCAIVCVYLCVRVFFRINFLTGHTHINTFKSICVLTILLLLLLDSLQREKK